MGFNSPSHTTLVIYYCVCIYYMGLKPMEVMAVMEGQTVCPSPVGAVLVSM